MCLFLLFFKHKTAYEMRISDWSSDVCSSDLASGFAEDALLQPTLLAAFPRQMTERFQPTILAHRLRAEIVATELANRMVNRSGIVLPFALAEEEGCALGQVAAAYAVEIGRASCRERVCQSGVDLGGRRTFKKKKHHTQQPSR